MQGLWQKATWGLVLGGVALLLRLYTLTVDLPYFYHEDEAHHFNRTVNMAKNLDFNPHYFHKPSLHFYLRMPAVWMGAWVEAQRGSLASIKEIRTYSRYGLANYAFTASHPAIVVWTRAVSVALGVLLVMAVFIITHRLTGSLPASVLSGLLTAVSPDLVTHSGIVGVDMLMAALCWATMLLGLRYLQYKSRLTFIACALVGGLAVSAKYNALPVVSVAGLIALTERPFSWRLLLLSIVLPIAGFLAGSPYVLIEPEMFLKDLGYEIWHYGVAGHVGHMEEPGLAQAWFYLSWLYHESIGACATLAAAGGLLALLALRGRKSLIFCAFPVLFFVEMVLQKANFTRNMIVFIPFLGVLAALAAHHLAALIHQRSAKALFWVLAGLALCGEPLTATLRERAARTAHVDTRTLLVEWFKAHPDPSKRTALSGYLQLPRTISSLPYTFSFDEKRSSPRELFDEGYDRAVIGKQISPHDFSKDPFAREAARFPGSEGKLRIVRDPFIYVYDLAATFETVSALLQEGGYPLRCSLALAHAHQSPPMAHEMQYRCGDEREPFCWTTHRTCRVTFEATSSTASTTIEQSEWELEVMTPWSGQALYIIDSSGNAALLHEFQYPGKWERFKIGADLSRASSENGLVLYTRRIETPIGRGLNEDTRSLGVAIRSVTRLAQPGS